MITCPMSDLVMVLCVVTLVGIVGSDPNSKGVHYKQKHLEKARGTLVYPRYEHHVISSSTGESDLRKKGTEQNYPLQRSYMLAIQPVPVDVYREAMAEARTHYDVFRIFIPSDVSDAEIDRMLWSMDVMSDALNIIRGSGSPHFTPEQWEQWEKTKSEADEHGRCGRPVPEVIRVREILAGGDEEYFPSCVLRYRCRRDAGCCQHEFQVCSASKTEKIEKTVLVAKVHSEDHRVHYQNLTMKTFTVDNDTECGCVDLVTPVEKPCPHPFIYDMDTQQCKCRDISFKRSCRRILKGEKKLLPSDIRCIKDEKCRALSICFYGSFDTDKCQCPRKEETVKPGND